MSPVEVSHNLSLFVYQKLVKIPAALLYVLLRLQVLVNLRPGAKEKRSGSRPRRESLPRSGLTHRVGIGSVDVRLLSEREGDLVEFTEGGDFVVGSRFLSLQRFKNAFREG